MPGQSRHAGCSFQRKTAYQLSLVAVACLSSTEAHREPLSVSQITDESVTTTGQERTTTPAAGGEDLEVLDRMAELQKKRAEEDALMKAQVAEVQKKKSLEDDLMKAQVMLRKAQLQKKRAEEDAEIKAQDLAAARKTIVDKQEAVRKDLLSTHAKMLADQRADDNNKEETIKADLKTADAKVEHWQESLKEEAFATGRWVRVNSTREAATTYKYDIGLADAAGVRLPDEHQKDMDKFQRNIKFGSAGKLFSFMPDALATVKKDLVAAMGNCSPLTKVQTCSAAPGKTVWMYRWTIEAEDHKLNTGHFRCHVTDGAEDEPECPFGFCGIEDTLCESSKCREWRDQTVPLDSNAQEKHKEISLSEAQLEVAKVHQSLKDHEAKREEDLQQLKDSQAREQAELQKAQSDELLAFDGKRDDELKKEQDKLKEEEQKVADLQEQVVKAGGNIDEVDKASEQKAKAMAAAAERAKNARSAEEAERQKEVFELQGHWEANQGILELKVNDGAANGTAISQDGVEANLTFPEKGKIVMQVEGSNIEGNVTDFNHIEWSDGDKWTRENNETELHYDDWTVHMRKKPSQHWGISLWKHKKVVSESMLTVKDIGEIGKHGVIPEQNEWFKQHNMVNRQLRIGDEILKINCKSDVPGMLEEMRTQDHLKMVVRREPLTKPTEIDADAY